MNYHDEMMNIQVDQAKLRAATPALHENKGNDMQYNYVSLEPIFKSAITDEPVIWIDHTGRPLKLSQMETSHLVNIMRRVVNAWAVSKGVAPIPIPNPLATIAAVESLSVLLRARLFGQEIRRRLDAGETLSPAYARIWAAVLDKARELLHVEGGVLGGDRLRIGGII